MSPLQYDTPNDQMLTISSDRCNRKKENNIQKLNQLVLFALKLRRINGSKLVTFRSEVSIYILLSEQK